MFRLHVETSMSCPAATHGPVGVMGNGSAVLKPADRLILSPTDLTGHLACWHLTQLELSAVRGERERPDREDPELDVLTRRGIEHEDEYLQQVKDSGRSVVEIELARDEWSPDGLAAAQDRTLDAMRSGTDVIFQATFFDGTWMGLADFLERVDRPSDLGEWSYEVVDTKLARRVKPAMLLQLCSYSEQVARLQGSPPEQVHVQLGDGTRASFRLRDLSAYFRTVKARFEEAVTGEPVETYPDPVAHCSVCRWQEVCQQRRRDDDHLSLVAGMRRDQTAKLNDLGVETVEDFVRPDGELRVEGIGGHTLERLQHQARLQLRERETGQRQYEVLQVELEQGLGLLPKPSLGDLFFDMEGDPFVGDDGLEYLFGAVELDGDGGYEFHEFWAHSPTEEKRAFEELVDLIIDRLDRHPDMHVYHYASYEETALKKLMGRHGTREDEVDRILRGNVLVDLYRVVRQGMRVSAESYSLKELEPLYMDRREGEITDAGSSIVAYEEWLDTGQRSILDHIAAYNEDDCVSTWKLRDWLEERREEAAGLFGTEVPRPGPREGEAPDQVEAAQAEVAALTERLLVDVQEDVDDRDDEQQARWLLAQLLSWHRREAKSEWWAYFTRMDMTDEELTEDRDSIGGLTFEAHVGPEKRSQLYAYRFDAHQDFTVDVGDSVDSRDTDGGAGTVFDLDPARGRVVLKTTRSPSEPHPTSLVPYDIVFDTPLREALQRVARWVIANGIDTPGRYRAARDLLLGRSPNVDGRSVGAPLARDGEEPLPAAKRLVQQLDDGCLPIQGPPGAGKTYTAARAIVELVRAGNRVGITALSHKAIGNLLDETCVAAEEAGVTIRALQKAPEGSRCASEIVECTNSNDDVESAVTQGEVDIVAGTAWLFAREALEQQFDVLFVDEASQLPLANAVVVGCAARNLVLVGDPQQLAQPSKGSHPPGSELSALEHLLGGRETFPPDCGLFLDTTYRLHPDIVRFTSEVFYEGRLEADARCAARGVEEGSEVGGTGLRFVPVEHEGDRIESPDEAQAVRRVVEGLLGNRWTDEDGTSRALTLNDIVIVAPYNAQVAEIQRHLPDDARVGTVDKFQGQEAPVAIYSMATATPEDMPRGMEFLYSTNRLNVATSRAQALSVLVCSPHLLSVRCRRAEQVRLANALCRFVEIARESTNAPRP